MRTTIKNIESRFRVKTGFKDEILIRRDGTRMTINLWRGLFWSNPIEFDCPAKLSDWLTETWTDHAVDAWLGQWNTKNEEFQEAQKKTLLIIKRIHKKMDNDELAKYFRKSIKLGLNSYSSSAARHDLRKATDAVLCRNVLGELKSFVKKSNKNQILSIDMIRRLCYTYLIEHVKRKSKTLIGDTNMAAKKKVAKKKAAKKSVKKVDNVSVDELLKQLDKATEQTDKRKIRARLRRSGHAGGLGKKIKATSKKATKKVAKKKVAKKKAAKKSTK